MIDAMISIPYNISIYIYTHILYTVYRYRYIYRFLCTVYTLYCIHTYWLVASFWQSTNENKSIQECILTLMHRTDFHLLAASILSGFCLAKTESPIWVDVLRSHAKTCFFHNKNFTLREGIMLNHHRNSPLKWLNTTTRGTTGGTMAGGVPNPPRFDSFSCPDFAAINLRCFLWGFDLFYPGLRASLRKRVREELCRCWGLNKSWELIPSMERGPRIFLTTFEGACVSSWEINSQSLAFRCPLALFAMSPNTPLEVVLEILDSRLWHMHQSIFHPRASSPVLTSTVKTGVPKHHKLHHQVSGPKEE